MRQIKSHTQKETSDFKLDVCCMHHDVLASSLRNSCIAFTLNPNLYTHTPTKNVPTYMHSAHVATPERELRSDMLFS